MQGLFGFSVQYHPGATIDELADAGRFPNPSISYATRGELAVTAHALGYIVELVASPGRGFHSTLRARVIATGMALQSLPDDLALALSAQYRRMPNPHRGP